jgi:ribosomal protein S18 acetylase RimI-like enzyme
MIIRKYQKSDYSSVEHIQFETYFLGKSGSLLVTNQKRFNKDIKYYLEKEPESCFVAEDNGKVVGYLLGCLDDNNNDESISAFFMKSLLRLFALPFMNRKDRRFWWSSTKMLFNAIIGNSEEMKFIPPKDSGHIHINLLAQARGKGAGTKLIKAFVKYAKSKGVKRIHADSFQTSLNPNKNFWIKNGFKEYLNIKTGFWKKYYPKEDIRLVCYVKEL